jgi:hypothetical protein
MGIEIVIISFGTIRSLAAIDIQFADLRPDKGLSSGSSAKGKDGSAVY